MTIGRNDPCPCGSGKKYKKCCLGKASQTATPAVGSQSIERRFFCVVTSYCTQGALEEALKPGGMVHIHPYVLIKLREDPALLVGLSPAQRARVLQLWRPSRLGVMPIDEIETRLRLSGVLSYDRAEFIQLTKSRQSAWLIAEEWSQPLAGLDRADRDFMGLAACELWRRLCPDNPSLEMIDDWLCEGYALAAEKKPAEALAAWGKVWEALRSRLTPDLKNLRDAGESVFPGMSQMLSNWSVDVRMEALNGSWNDALCGEFGIRFIREMRDALKEEDDSLNCSGDLAMLHFNLRRDAEGEKICEQLIHDHPDWAVGYVTLSDAVQHRASREGMAPTQLQRAVGLLERALARPVRDAKDFDLPARLADAREALSKARSS